MGIRQFEKLDRKTKVGICLDEIRASFRHLERGKLNEKGMSKQRGWIAKHKEILKELKYKGKMPRKGR